MVTINIPNHPIVWVALILGVWIGAKGLPNTKPVSAGIVILPTKSIIDTLQQKVEDNQAMVQLLPIPNALPENPRSPKFPTPSFETKYETFDLIDSSFEEFVIPAKFKLASNRVMVRKAREYWVTSYDECGCEYSELVRKPAIYKTVKTKQRLTRERRLFVFYPGIKKSGQPEIAFLP